MPLLSQKRARVSSHSPAQSREGWTGGQSSSLEASVPFSPSRSSRSPLIPVLPFSPTCFPQLNSLAEIPTFEEEKTEGGKVSPSSCMEVRLVVLSTVSIAARPSYSFRTGLYCRIIELELRITRPKL